MVEIYSRKDDGSVNEVIDWLYAYNKKFKRHYPQEWGDMQDTFQTDAFYIADSSKRKEGPVWVRNWKRPSLSAHPNWPGLHKNLEADLNAVYDLKSYYAECDSLARDMEKPRQLELAHKVGLNIPKTLITNDKKALITFAEEHKTIITKPLAFPYTYLDPAKKEKPKLSYTRVLEMEEITGLPEVFSYGLFQEKVEKKFEIRSFFLAGKIWSMAIFSQGSEQTEVDFRNYNVQQKNRTVPFMLPKTIQRKVIKFMEVAQLQWGSLDFAYTPNGEIIFFEVNPQGQFGMLSKPCNYHLEEKIAEHLLTQSLY